MEMRQLYLRAASASVLAAGLAFAGAASAAPTYCSDADPHKDGLTTGDVTFETQSASDCYGLVPGNPDTSNNATLPFTKWGSFDFLVKDDDNAMDNKTVGTFEGVTFELEALGIDETSGTWNLSWSGAGLPIILDFVVNLKGADFYASYLFEGVSFLVDPDTGSGTFQMYTFLNAGNQLQTPDLSNVSIFVRSGETTIVPAPGTLGLLGLGLFGMAFVTRRRNKS